VVQVVVVVVVVVVVEVIEVAVVDEVAHHVRPPYMNSIGWIIF
jgi:hypothetical protein